MIKNSDIGFWEAIDTALDLIVEKVIQKSSEYYSIDDEIRDFIELNRFERANIIIANFYANRAKFNINERNIEDKLITLIFDSLVNPFILEGTDKSEIEFLRENPLNESDENRFLFDNKLFSWYEFDDKNRKDLKRVIRSIINANKENEIHTLEVFDKMVYDSIISNPDLLKSMKWRDFEKLLAYVLEKLEFEIELKKGTKDGGIDIIAIKKNTPFGPDRYLIQAKRWKNKVGVEPVRSLIWAHNEYRVTKSCLATTSYFTRGAWNLANQYKWQVELKDYERIIEWIRLSENN